MRTIQKLYQMALLTGKRGMEILEDRLVKELPITPVANTHSGDGTPFRGNYAGIGYTYDAI